MKLQLLAVVIFIGVIPMFIISFMIITCYEKQGINQKVEEMRYQGNKVADLILENNYYEESGSEEAKELEDTITKMARIYKGRIIIIDHNLKIRKDTNGFGFGKTVVSPEVVSCMKGNENSYRLGKKEEFIEVLVPVFSEESQEIIGAVVMNASMETIHLLKDKMGQRTTAFISVLSVLVIIFAFFYCRRVTNPLKRITGSIDRVAEGYLDEILSIKGYTEIESIADSFNKMLAKLQTVENSRQEFVSNVSHELKTPITSIKVLADSLLQQEELPVELYREFLEDINDEIERENKIITDLLSLVKLDKTAGELNIETVNINELLEQILKRLRPIASERNIELIFESYRTVTAEIDEVKLSLAVSNLIENAIKYNFDDGWVRVSLNADHKFFYIKVMDSGVGIPDDEQDNIFERFYRVDKARSRETGGTGLGLSITRNAILMHRGAIKVYSKEKEGTTFTVRIPLAYVA